MNYGDMIDQLEAGNWKILDVHFQAKLKRVSPEDAILEVHEDITAFCELHYDGGSEKYRTVMNCLSKWEQAQG